MHVQSTQAANGTRSYPGRKHPILKTEILVTAEGKPEDDLLLLARADHEFRELRGRIEKAELEENNIGALNIRK